MKITERQPLLLSYEEYNTMQRIIVESKEAVKIATLLKAKKGYIKSKKGNIMELRISNITHNGSRYMVNGYCTYSDNCRVVPLNEVYVSEVLSDEYVGKKSR